MSLPKAIEREARQAQAAQEQLQLSLQAQEAATAPAVDQTQVQAVEVPTPAPTQQAAPAAPVQEVQKDPEQTWEQRYRSLQGHSNRVMAELNAANKARESEAAQLRQQVEQLTLLVQKSQAPDKPAEKPAADPRDVENFGAEMIEMVQRYAERVFQSLGAQFGARIEALEKHVKGIEHGVTSVSERTDATLKEQFWVTLATLVPDWEAINASDGWLNWLSEIDPVYGVARQAALEAAFNALSAERVANVFRAYLQTVKTPKPESLENQLAPTSVAPALPSAPAPAPVVTQKFVENFYNDVARGKYAKTPELAAQIEADIQRAAREGRIR